MLYNLCNRTIALFFYIAVITRPLNCHKNLFKYALQALQDAIIENKAEKKHA